MRKPRQRSLRRVLTRGMLIMQALALVAFTAAAAIPILYYLSSSQVLDDMIINDVVKSIHRDEEGALVLSPSKRVTEIASAHDHFWLQIWDAKNDSVSFGAVPELISALKPALPYITSANLTDVAEPYVRGETRHAVVRQRNIDGENMWIATGDGPVLGPEHLPFVLSNPMTLGLLVVLGIVTFLAVPYLVRRALKGLSDVSDQANMIGTGQAGVRLNAQDAPVELQNLIVAFNAALDRLDSGMVRQRRFIADAAHELRTPIAVLQSQLEMLPNGTEKQQFLLGVGRLSGLANQLLDLHRMSLLEEETSRIDLVELASQVASDIAPLVISGGGEISFVNEVEHIYVLGHEGPLSRAVSNLIQNAIAHGGPGVSVEVAVLSNGRIRISDTGPGIAPEHREEIFWPFHRVAPKSQGAGLGLSLVHDIVRRHGGRIAVDNGAGGGAVFEVILPTV